MASLTRTLRSVASTCTASFECTIESISFGLLLSQVPFRRPRRLCRGTCSTQQSGPGRQSYISFMVRAMVHLNAPTKFMASHYLYSPSTRIYGQPLGSRNAFSTSVAQYMGALQYLQYLHKRCVFVCSRSCSCSFFWM